MKKIDVGFIAVFVGLAIFIGTLLITTYFADATHWSQVNGFENILEVELGVRLQKGIVKSPSVIIEMDETNEFIAKITELRASIIYYETWNAPFGREVVRYYYVFAEGYAIAYRLSL